MFLLKCDEDKSYCMINDEDVIFDDETVKKGETVRFYYKKKQYTGDVIMFSDDQDAIEKELKRCKTEMKQSSKKSKHACKKFDIKKPCNDKIADRKQMRTTEEKTGRKIYFLKTKNIEETVNSNISSKRRKMKDLDEPINSSRSSSTTYSSDDETEEKSPTKEELIKLLQDANNKITKLQSEVNSSLLYNDKNVESDKQQRMEKNDEIASVANRDEEEEELIEDHPVQNASNFSDEVENYYNDDQLFGADWANDNMILLENGIFCKKRILEAALSTAKKASHLARQLIPAVFKPKAILKSTLKGQSPRVTKLKNPVLQVDCLHGVAKDAIIAFSKKYARKKGWSQQSIKEIELAMTQKVGELKRQAAKNEIV